MLVNIFEELVIRYPNHPAVKAGEKVLTYAELNELANQVARSIGEGVTRVGLVFEHGTDMIVGMVGALKAVKPYVPLDPTYPVKRLEYMIRDAGINLLVTNYRNLALVEELARVAVAQGSGSPVKHVEGEAVAQESEETVKQGNVGSIEVDSREVVTNAEKQDGVKRDQAQHGMADCAGDTLMELTILNIDLLDETLSKDNLGLTVEGSQVAYILYTSGSTGNPKGVVQSYENIWYYIRNYTKTFGLTVEDRLTLFSAFGHDAAVMDIYSGILNGATLYPLNLKSEANLAELSRWLNMEKITVYHSVPTVYRYFLKTLGKDDLFPHLRWIILGGEAVLEHDVAAFKQVFHDNTRLANLYGQSESSFNSVKIFGVDARSHKVTLGEVIDEMELLLIDEDGEEVDMLETGEIVVACHHVALGYWNDPEKTQRSFSTDEVMGRLYWTGDLGRHLSDGTIEFLGRKDFQVKVRGYRVDLGGIESALLDLPGIREAVVLARADSDGTNELWGYIVPTGAIDIAELKAVLARTLPDYMIPPYFVMLEKMPLTPTNKTDRKALMELDDGLRVTGTPFVAPVNETEERLAQIWCEILGLERVGTAENFFEIGGHSLKAVTMVAQVFKVLQVELPITQIFATPTVGELAKWIVNAEKGTFVEIPQVEKRDFFPLSAAQRRLYVLHQLDRKSLSYNLPNAFVFEGGLERRRLIETFRALMRRHESLRSSFRLVDGEPVQIVHEDLPLDLSYYMTENEEEAVMLAREFVRPFDLQTPPLLRVGLIECDGKQILLIDLHHIIADGSSKGILFAEFLKLYSGEELPPLRIQYRDFAVWQNDYLQGEILLRQGEYWLSQFAEVQTGREIPVLNLPMDHARPVVQSFKGDQHFVWVDEMLTARLGELARETGTTLFMVLLAVFNVLLQKYTAQEDIVVGTPVAGRRHVDLQFVIGMFVNTLALRNEPKMAKTFGAFLREIRERTLMAFEYQDYPFEELVEQLHLERDLSRNPLFDVMFRMQNFDTPAAKVEGELRYEPFYFTHKIAQFDLTLTCYERDGGLRCSLDYCALLFKPERMERMAKHWVQLLTQVVENPNAILADLEMLSTEEKAFLLVECNQTDMVFPEDRTVHGMMADQAVMRPTAVAIRFEDEVMTYGELNARADRLGRMLRQRGLRRNGIVGVLTERSMEMMVALFGILKAGGAYMPIDPHYPAERIDFMLEDSSSQIVLIQEKWLDRMERLPIEWIVLEHLGGDELVDLEKDPEFNATESDQKDDEAGPNDLMYVIYTSGSTGKPKGVMVEHRSVVNRLHWMQRAYPLTQEDVILQKTPYTFDVSVWELFWWSLYGASVGLLKPTGEKEPAVIADAVGCYGATILHFVPSMLHAFLDYVEKNLEVYALRSLRWIFASGEALTPWQVNRFNTLLGRITGTRLVNLYGPTEATVDVTYFNCPNKEGIHEIPIGKPIDNTQVYILDSYLHPQPIGVPGELHIAGVGVARGYLNRPGLTEEKFILNPFGEGRLYKTGDLACWRADGNIEYLGRLDDQVKIRGFRIELGEVESALLKHPAIAEALVMAKPVAGDPALVAYLVPKEEITVSDLRAILAKELPEYMIPAYFVYLPAFPLSVNGKIDRKALPQPSETMSLGREYVAPQTRSEERLAAIWADLLKVERVGMEDHFFELGGHSLKALTLLARVEKEFQIVLSLSEFFQKPTVAAMAKMLRTSKQSAYAAIERIPEAKYYPVSSAQRRLFVLHQLEKGSLHYNLPMVVEIQGRLERKRVMEGFAQLVKRHEALRTYFAMVDGELVQRIVPDAELPVQEMATDPLHIEEVVRELIRPFDLWKAPLARVGLITAGAQEFLFFDVHHIIADGVSRDILFREFIDLYTGASLPEPAIQYKDFACWQNALFDSDRFREQEEFWLDQLAPEKTGRELPLLQLPLDFPRPAQQSFHGRHWTVVIESRSANALRQLSKESGATLYMTLLAAYNALLYRYTGQEDIIVGTPIYGRSHADLETVVGMFVNTLVLRNNPSADQSFREFLSDVRHRTVEAFECQDYPFEMLVERLNIPRNLSRNPLFDTMFKLQNFYSQQREIPGAKLVTCPLETQVAQFDLQLSCTEINDEIHCVFEYCTDLFAEETIAGLAGHFLNLITGIAADPDQRLADIAMLTEAEQRRLLYEWNDTYAECAPVPVHWLFEAQVERTPERVALVVDGERWTYQELNVQANQLAHRLRSLGVGRETVVGILLPRSVEMIAGLLGVLKAGGAYLPLDVGYPAERIDYMLRDSEARLLLVGGGIQVPAGFAGDVVDLRDWVCRELSQTNEAETTVNDADPAQRCTDNPSHINEPTDLMYLIYTSGSTGRPKGTMLEHRSVHNFIQGMCDTIPMDERMTIFSMTTISFDIFVLESFLPLSVGAKVVLATEWEQLDHRQAVQRILQEQVNMIQMTPSRLQLWIEDPEAWKALTGFTTILVGGEACPAALLGEIHRITNARIFNMYGPTETTVWSTVQELTTAKRVTIGRPIRNTRVYVLNERHGLVPEGVSGELYIAGKGLARGYCKNPEITAERFLPDPFVAGARMYRTGDLVRWLRTGEIEFLGRVDRQVKIRGYRIETGEIEAHLNTFPGVKESVVLAKERDHGYKYLVGYYVAAAEIPIAELRANLMVHLAEYMVPSYFLHLEAMPLTPNGKTDHRALMAMEHDTVGMVQTVLVPPKTELEKRIAELWKEVLKVDQVGLEDNFFERGGNSMNAVQLHIRLEGCFPGEVTIADLFTYPTIQRLTRYLEEKRQKSDGAELAQAYWAKELSEPLELLQLPAEYYCLDAEEPVIFKNRLNKELSARLREIAVEEGVAVEDLLLGMFMYLLTSLANQKELVLMTSDQSPTRRHFPIRCNLAEMEDVGGLVRLVQEKRHQGAVFADYPGDAVLMKHYTDRTLIPFFSFNGQEWQGADLTVLCDLSSDEIGWVCKYQMTRLKGSKVHELLKALIQLLEMLTVQYER